MGITGWLARMLRDDSASPTTASGAASLPAQAQQEAAGGLNFRSAIEAHQKWKLRLQAVIESSSREKLDPSVIGRDDQCELGKWIHGAGGRQFGAELQFADLSRKHAYFHVCAGRVLSLAQNGQKKRALTEISATGEFGRVSREVIGDLASMFVRLNETQQ
jgi:hypothetical protein